MKVSPATQRASEIVHSLKVARAHNRLEQAFGSTRRMSNPIGPYDWQVDFFNAGATHPQRCLQAANGVGKTGYVGTPEIAIHATGNYPDWWKGRRFVKPPEIVIGSETNELSRDVIQRYLLGPLGEWGTGWIPNKNLLKDSINLRQCSVSQCVDTFRVRHKSGGYSVVTMKTYEQGRQKWQGLRRDIILLDEQPPADIWTEALSRGLGRDWLMMLTYTPLLGQDDVASHFMRGGPGVYLQSATWDDAPHLSEDSKSQLLSAYPEHERDARSKGIPRLGHGAIYPIQDEYITCAPFEIPSFYKRICGIDFGWDHPTAAAWLAQNPESKEIFVYDCYRQSAETPVYHAKAIKDRGEWIPVAWPHDGKKTDIGSGKSASDHYRDHGVNMLPDFSRYRDIETGEKGRKPIIQRIYEAMRAGTFKVFETCNHWMEEKRTYHMDERGNVVLKRDDVMSATETAMMMLRYARTEHGASQNNRPARAQDYDPFGAAV